MILMSLLQTQKSNFILLLFSQCAMQSILLGNLGFVNYLNLFQIQCRFIMWMRIHLNCFHYLYYTAQPILYLLFLSLIIGFERISRKARFCLYSIMRVDIPSDNYLLKYSKKQHLRNELAGKKEFATIQVTAHCWYLNQIYHHLNPFLSFTLLYILRQQLLNLLDLFNNNLF